MYTKLSLGLLLSLTSMASSASQPPQTQSEHSLSRVCRAFREASTDFVRNCYDPAVQFNCLKKDEKNEVGEMVARDLRPIWEKLVEISDAWREAFDGGD